MSRLFSALFISASVVLAGCVGSIKTNTLVDDTAKLSTYKTYSWASKPLSGTNTMQAIDQKVRLGVDQAMRDKGYMLVSSGADMTVDYRIHSETAVTDTAGMTPHDYIEAALGDNAKIAEMSRSRYANAQHGHLTKGQIVIFVADGESNKISWLTTASKLQKKSNAPQQEVLASVKKGITKAMRSLPKSK